MKRLKILAVLSLILLGSYAVQAQQTKKQKTAAEFKAMIENKKFVFVAQYANPLGGGHRYLNYDYNISIKPDSVISYLPYFGVVQFDPPLYPTQDGIMFTSTHFSYQTTARKKGNYLIIIKPTDAKYIQNIYLNVSTNGNASADFTITNRTSISFDGYIVESLKPDNKLAKQESKR